MMLDCMHNRIPVTERTTTSNKTATITWLMSGNKSLLKKITQSIKNYTKQKAVESQRVDFGIKKLKVSIHNMFTLVCILNFSIELCTVAMCKNLLSYCISRKYMEVCGKPQYGFYVLVRALLRGL